MNIAGIVVRTAPEHVDQVLETLKASGLCDVHFHDETGNIIVTVEGTDTGEEVKKMRDIMNLPHVLCVDLAYSYHEDGIEGNLDELERIRDAVPNALKSLLSDA
jgi:nitrate reductase NapD